MNDSLGWRGDGPSSTEDVGEEESQNDANHIQSKVGFVDKVSPKTCDDNVDDENDAIDQEQIVLLVIGSISSQKTDEESNDTVEEERDGEAMSVLIEQVFQKDDNDIDSGDDVDDQERPLDCEKDGILIGHLDVLMQCLSFSSKDCCGIEESLFVKKSV